MRSTEKAAKRFKVGYSQCSSFEELCLNRIDFTIIYRHLLPVSRKNRQEFMGKLIQMPGVSNKKPPMTHPLQYIIVGCFCLIVLGGFWASSHKVKTRSLASSDTEQNIKTNSLPVIDSNYLQELKKKKLVFSKPI